MPLVGALGSREDLGGVRAGVVLWPFASRPCPVLEPGWEGEGCVALLGAALVPCSTLAAQGQLVLVRLLVCVCGLEAGSRALVVKTDIVCSPSSLAAGAVGAACVAYCCTSIDSVRFGVASPVLLLFKLLKQSLSLSPVEFAVFMLLQRNRNCPLSCASPCFSPFFPWLH